MFSGRFSLRRVGLSVVVLAVTAALTAAAAAGSPARSGTYSGVEYHDGQATEFISMTLTVSSTGRTFRNLQGRVEATCTSAGAPNYFEFFDFDFPTATKISGNGTFKKDYSTTTDVSGAEAHETLELTGRFVGSRITQGTFAFHAYIEGQGPGCEYVADWRGKRR